MIYKTVSSVSCYKLLQIFLLRTVGGFAAQQEAFVTCRLEDWPLHFPVMGWSLRPASQPKIQVYTVCVNPPGLKSHLERPLWARHTSPAPRPRITATMDLCPADGVVVLNRTEVINSCGSRKSSLVRLSWKTASQRQVQVCKQLVCPGTPSKPTDYCADRWQRKR